MKRSVSEIRWNCIAKVASSKQVNLGAYKLKGLQMGTQKSLRLIQLNCQSHSEYAH